MPRNRRKGSNHIELGRVYLWIVLVVLFAVFGLSVVYMKNTLHALGDQRRVMEKKVKQLDQDIATVNSQVVEWNSRAVLQRRLDEGFIVLSPIPDDRIVRLHHLPTDATTDIRPVSTTATAP